MNSKFYSQSVAKVPQVLPSYKWYSLWDTFIKFTVPSIHVILITSKRDSHVQETPFDTIILLLYSFKPPPWIACFVLKAYKISTLKGSLKNFPHLHSRWHALPFFLEHSLHLVLPISPSHCSPQQTTPTADSIFLTFIPSFVHSFIHLFIHLQWMSRWLLWGQPLQHA